MHHSRTQEIVDTIVDLVESRGVGRVTTAALARRLGFTEAALYRYFSGKGAILAAALQQVAEELFASMQSELPTGAATDFEERLACHTRRFTSRHGALLELLLAATTSRESELQEAGNAFLQEYLQRMSWYFESLIEAGAISAATPPAELASAWTCQLLGGFVRSRLTLDRWEPDEHNGFREFLAKVATPAAATL